MNFDELCKRIRELAMTGKDWHRVTLDDSIGDAWETLFGSVEFDRQVIEAAFVAGRRVYRMANGWVIAWTNARVDYDQFDTEELACHEWHHRPLRKVLMHPENAVYQRGRYLSGASVWDEDPRIVEERIRIGIERDHEEHKIREAIREAGLVWLRKIVDLDSETANEDAFDDELRNRRLQWSDVRQEQKRRDEEAATAERAAEWNRCRSMFVDGCTIVDPGRDAKQGQFGVIPGSDCAVYRNVRVVPHWSAKDSVEDARVEDTRVEDTRVEDERHTDAGSLWFVAEQLTKGEYRIATADECLLPALVLDRLKPSRLHDVLRVEAEGRVVWAGREYFLLSDVSVLDEQGKLVRKKSIKEAAIRAFRAKDGGM